MTQTASESFIDRRTYELNGAPAVERRQFANSHAELPPAVQELAQAIDQYKVRHRRRFITYDEILNVILQLGYHK